MQNQKKWHHIRSQVCDNSTSSVRANATLLATCCDQVSQYTSYLLKARPGELVPLPPALMNGRYGIVLMLDGNFGVHSSMPSHDIKRRGTIFLENPRQESFRGGMLLPRTFVLEEAVNLSSGDSGHFEIWCDSMLPSTLRCNPDQASNPNAQQIGIEIRFNGNLTGIHSEWIAFKFTCKTEATPFFAEQVSFVITQQVTIALPTRRGGFQTFLDSNANRFVPNHLKSAFSFPPRLWYPIPQLDNVKPQELLWDSSTTDPEHAITKPLQSEHETFLQRWIDLQEREDILRQESHKEYDMFFQKLSISLVSSTRTKQHNKFDAEVWQTSLQVPGILESRPRVQLYDSVLIRFDNEKSAEKSRFDCESNGIVVAVRGTTIFVAFQAKFRKKTKTKTMINAHIRFVYQNTIGAMLKQLRHSESLPRLERFLNSLNAKRFYQITLNANADCALPQDNLPDWDLEQAATIERIVQTVPDPQHNQTREDSEFILPPIVVFGPPGTGKTTVVSGAILKLFNRHKASGSYLKVLICTPTNAACDVVTDALVRSKQFTKDNLLRLHSQCHPFTSVSHRDTVLKHVLVDSVSGLFRKPSRSELVTPNLLVVCCTCKDSAIVIPSDVNFTHIFVDECSQATEPETYLPLRFAINSTCLVLAGDPKQLGPVVTSPYAQQGGLGVSLQERLVNEEAMQQQQGRRVVCQLIRNYRSQHGIIAVPSTRFYNNSLVVEAPDHKLALFPSQFLPNGTEKDASSPALVFLAVKGEELSEVDSPSLFNMIEAMVLVGVIKQLGDSVSQPDIAVICAFRAQVLHVRKLLREEQLGQVRVGSVQDFQGQEAKVTIITTVLCNHKTIDRYKKSEPLGFMWSSKRFNVAMTRAQALNVVVGFPNVLQLDDNWSHVIQFTKQHGTFREYEG